MVGTTIKTVKGRTYLYFTYYDPNTKSKKEIYCGLATDSNSTRNALEFESNKLKEQKKRLVEKIDQIEFELKKRKKKIIAN